MPELPEVEVVRRGLADHVAGRTITGLELRGERVARRHAFGPADLSARVAGRRVEAARRRGKYLWLELTDPSGRDDAVALLCHLGMSGQMLVEAADALLDLHSMLWPSDPLVLAPSSPAALAMARVIDPIPPIAWPQAPGTPAASPNRWWRRT